jgi:hypothetical protein
LSRGAEAHFGSGSRPQQQILPCGARGLDAYIETVGLFKDRKEPLFRSAIGKTGTLADKAMSPSDVWCVATPLLPASKRRFGCHTFRVTGITDYLTDGGRIEVAQRLAGDSNAKTTGLYGRRRRYQRAGGALRSATVRLELPSGKTITIGWILPSANKLSITLFAWHACVHSVSVPPMPCSR